MDLAIYNILLPGRADTWFPSLPRKECTGVRYVMTKFSRMDGLPNFLTHGAPLARFAPRSFATKIELEQLHELMETQRRTEART